MKSYLFTTENGRGGVILCDIDTFEEAVEYLQQRFDGVIRVEQGRTLWTLESGFGEFVPTVRVDSPAQAPPDENAQAAQAQTPELF